MKTVGIVGHFALEKNLLNGQTVKTKIITDELILEFGIKNVKKIDTHTWGYNPFFIIYQSLKMFKSCDKIIFMPARRGLKVIVPLFIMLNKFYDRDLHYVVIGGWLPDVLKSNRMLMKLISALEAVYVETHTMVKLLNTMGINNVYYLPNFKKLIPIGENELTNSKEKPYKLCTFSRVMKEKGIEEAIKAVTQINEEANEIIYTLDIYGQVETNYEEKFNEIQKQLPPYISYKGLISYDRSTTILKSYFALLFPTVYKGEGFPGTVIDAFTSGVPVIATDWKYNNEVIQNGKTGFIYNDFENGLKKQLVEIAENPDKVLNMKKNCVEESKKFSADVVMKQLISKLELY